MTTSNHEYDLHEDELPARLPDSVYRTLQAEYCDRCHEFVERDRERHNGDDGTHRGCGGELYRLLPLERAEREKGRAEAFDRSLDSIGARTGLLDACLELLNTPNAAGRLSPGEQERLHRIEHARAQLTYPEEDSQDLVRIFNAAMKVRHDVGNDGAGA